MVNGAKVRGRELKSRDFIEKFATAFRSGSWRRASLGWPPRALGRSAVLAIVVGLVFAASASAARHPFLGTFGPTSQPTFSAATALAVDESTGDVLVADRESQTLSRFTPAGEPAPFSALGTNVIDGLGGADETPAGGLFFNTTEGSVFEQQIAVDNSTGPTGGDIYITQAVHVENAPPLKRIYIFKSSGEYAGQLTEAGGEKFREACGVAIDPSGAVYVGDYSGGVKKFIPSGPVVSDSDYAATFTSVSEPCTLSAGAGASDGSLFVGTYRGPISKVSAETGELEYVAAEGQHTTSAVDPATGRLLAVSEDKVEDIDATGGSPTVLSVFRTPALIEGIAASGKSARLYLGDSTAEERRHGASELREYGPLAPQAPLIEEAQVNEVFAGEAIIAAQIGAEGSPTTVTVEYGKTTAYGQTSEPVDAGGREALREITPHLTGLEPGTYHARIVATNGIGTSVSGDLVFSIPTQTAIGQSCENAALRIGPSAKLPDCRAYELVTPVEKEGIDIEPSVDLALGRNEVDQASLSGNALTFTSSQGIGETEGTSYSPQYLSTRLPEAGWQTRSITTKQGHSLLEAPFRVTFEYLDFTPDLCHGVLQNFAAEPIAEGTPEYGNLFERDLCEAGDPVMGLTPGQVGHEDPSREFPPQPGGISDDGRCVAYFPIEGQDGLPAAEQEGVRERCDGVTRQVNIKPNGELTEVAKVGSIPFASYGLEYTVRYASQANAVSSDGSVVYWTGRSLFGPDPAESLWVRVNSDRPASEVNSAGECTEPERACTYDVSRLIAGNTEATFLGASTDGSTAYFSTGQEGNDEGLFKYSLASKSAEKVAGGVPVLSTFTDTNAQPVSLYGVLGSSEDGSRAYFISTEALAGEGVKGHENVYLYDADAAGSKTRLVATLGPERNYSKSVPIQSSRVSPSGHQLLFQADATLAGYDNVDAREGVPATEVYLYDATANGGAGRLSCISCNPSGQRPRAYRPVIHREPAHFIVSGGIPRPYTAWHGARAISEDGTEAFFESVERLVHGDTNGAVDVYEWAELGTHGCTTDVGGYSGFANGCLSLISSGESATNSRLVDATAQGSDVFFATKQSLLPQDPGLVDIYDARVKGGFPPPPGPAPACEGEACQGPISPPAAVTPASSAYQGPGNVSSKPKKKKKQKHKKHHRTQHQRHGKHKQGRNRDRAHHGRRP